MKKQDPLTLRILVTSAEMIDFSHDHVKEVIEATLQHTAVENARVAMLTFGNDSAPLTVEEIFYYRQTMSWSDIVSRPYFMLNDMDRSLGEKYAFSEKDKDAMQKQRTAAEWERVIGAELNFPTFLEAVTKYLDKTQAQGEDGTGPHLPSLVQQSE